MDYLLATSSVAPQPVALLSVSQILSKLVIVYLGDSATRGSPRQESGIIISLPQANHCFRKTGGRSSRGDVLLASGLIPNHL